MKIRKEQIYFDFILLAFITIYLFLSINYSPVTRLVPLFIGIPTAIFIIFQLGKDIIEFRKNNKKENFDKQTKIDEDINQIQKTAMPIWVVFSCVTITVFLIYLFGFLIAIPILIIFFLRFQAKASWLFCISSAIALELVMYVGFINILNVLLYRGIIFITIYGR